MLAIPPHGDFRWKLTWLWIKKNCEKIKCMLENTTFDIVKMFLGSLQLAFRIYQIPMEHTVYVREVHSSPLCFS